MTKLKTSFLTLLSLGALITGCSTSELDDNGLTPTTSGVNISVSLDVKGTNSFAQSRAVSDDTWDDNDPPQEDALGNESAIASALIVIYSSSLSSVEDSSTETVKYVHTINGASATFAMPESLIGDNEKTYYALAVANPPSNLIISTSTTLGDLRQMTVGSVCQGTSVSTAYNFVMSSDQEVQFTVPARSSLTEGQTVKIPTITVERLAARVDISFGTNTLNEDNKIVLQVYDKNNPDQLTGDYFTISQVNVINVNDNAMYLIQRNNSGKRDTNKPDDTRYGMFGDEVWYKFTTSGQSGYYAQKTVNVPTTTKVTKNYALSGLMIDGTNGNNLYTYSGVKYYTLGYYMEQIKGLSSTEEAAKADKTTVQLQGVYHRISDLNHGQSADYNLTIDYCIRHGHALTGAYRYDRAMAYAVGRNTIYRLRIDKLFSDGEYVWVRWYYDSNNNGEYDEYTPSTPFTSLIEQSNSSTTVND